MSTFEPPFPQCDVAFDDPVAEQTVNQPPTDSEQRLLYLQRKFELIKNTRDQASLNTDCIFILFNQVELWSTAMHYGRAF